MANYNTNLSDWGATGQSPPTGYKYEDGVPPVDLYDNYLMDNIINDIQHLTSLTNDRLESDIDGARPSSPEDGHLFADSNDGHLEWYNPDTAQWSRALDAQGDTMLGVLDMGGYQIEDANGELTIDGNTNIQSGQLSEQGNRVATRTWATGSNINHADLVDAPASAHHSRYEDSEARGAVEAGNLSRVDGENSHSIRFDSHSSYVEITDQNNNRNDLVTKDTFVDDEGTWLSNHMTSNSAHHSRYEDSEARSAIGGETIDGFEVRRNLKDSSGNSNLSISVPSSDTWLSLDGGTNDGVLIGYYDADEVRVGSGNLSDFNWNGNTVATRSWVNNNADFEQVDFENNEHANLNNSSLGWDNSEGGPSFTGGLIFDDDNGTAGWVVHTKAGVYEIQKDGQDGNNVINFKTQ